jgi:SAM-dependent methyltransferase
MRRLRLGRTLGLVDYVGAVELSVGDAASVLDVGCGNNSPLGRFRRRVPYSVGVDIYTPWIDESRARGIHDRYAVLDVLSIEDEFGPEAFEAVVACDVLEHLTADDGAELLARMQRVASNRVVVLTPNGHVPQGATWGNPYQVHRSGWSAVELRRRGYAVRGVNGLKLFRGERGQLRLRPARLWDTFSQASQPLAWRWPDWAFHLLAVKEISGPSSANIAPRALDESSTPPRFGRAGS